MSAVVLLSNEEAAVLMREARGPVNGRVLNCAFGPGLLRLLPNPDGAYPRWVLLRLAVLRGLFLNDLTQEETVELTAFASAHDREVLT